MTQTDQHEKARRRAVAKYGCYVHAAVYAAVMTLLVAINVLRSPDTLWVIWPLIGWGLAVALHGLRVFVLADRNDFIDALTERELRRSGGRESDEGPIRRKAQ